MHVLDMHQMFFLKVFQNNYGFKRPYIFFLFLATQRLGDKFKCNISWNQPYIYALKFMYMILL